VILATTTSTQDSGLLDVLLPRFEASTGYRVKPIAVGTGEALKLGERGDADVVLVHAPEAEREFVASGAGVDRRIVMHNDFIFVGPPADPARVRGAPGFGAALRRLAASSAPFVSRGDDSGTHKKELALWKEAKVPKPSGARYIETGSGMGATLKVASEKRGYTLTDRGSYLSHRANLDLDIVVERDPLLLNPYHVIRVNPRRSPRVNAKGALAFAAFLVSPEAQRLIGEFGRDRYGEPLFIPDAGKSEDALSR
jgi:tungstate transport system substrate-binding protein